MPEGNGPRCYDPGDADMRGTTVETTIRIVSRWLTDGLVREEENRLVLVNVAALRDLAQGESGG